jgi:hypothetical protein
VLLRRWRRGVDSAGCAVEFLVVPRNPVLDRDGHPSCSPDQRVTARSSSYPASPGSRTEPATAVTRATVSFCCTGGSDESSKVIADVLFLVRKAGAETTDAVPNAFGSMECSAPHVHTVRSSW